jgi:hypothetical protein
MWKIGKGGQKNAAPGPAPSVVSTGVLSYTDELILAGSTVEGWITAYFADG